MEISLSGKYRRYHGAAKKPKSIRLLLKRFIQVLSCVTVFFAVGYAVFWCFDPAHFPITSVKFSGQRHYLTQEELREAILPEIKAGFFRLKVSTLQQRLLSLPWIKQADVRKVWPDQLVVRFEEHSPAAYWDDKGIISELGTCFYPDLTKMKALDLPSLKGPEGKSSFIWQQFLAMEDILAPLKLNITQVYLAPRGAWQVQLSNGITVVLGTNDTLARLKRFVSAYEKHLKDHEKKMAYVDLRYTNGMAIGWNAG
ncbi:MAG: cell division protein FtsQ/DivIB [Proteobacteria bacterium]|nr:cell division protein FtsQ/DivIB [Pseudomonadota bacterium]